MEEVDYQNDGHRMRIVVNGKILEINVVLNAVVMEDFLLNMNAMHVEINVNHHGQTIQHIAQHVMVMAVKRLTNCVMTVMDEVINEKKKRMKVYYFLFCSTKEEKALFF